MKRKDFLRKAAFGVPALGVSMLSLNQATGRGKEAPSASYRSIASVIKGQRVQVAPTVQVVRTLPVRGRNIIDPFLLLDHIDPRHIPAKNPIGVPPHPHRGFEPISFLFEGNIDHKDSLGNHGKLDSGDVQWMTSGSGIVHSEDIGKRFERNGGQIHAVQLWVNLPKKDKMTQPGYQNLPSSTIPVLDDGRVRLRVVAGEIFNIKGPAKTFTDVLALDLTLQPGVRLDLPVTPSFNAFFHVLQGKALLPDGQKVDTGNLALYQNDGLNAQVENAGDQPLHLLFLAGEPINEPVVQYGPFVMNSQEEIRQAYTDYQLGKMGGIDF